MHRTHNVNCCICNISLAFWSGFGDNYQFQEEWVCDNQKLKRKLDGVISCIGRYGKPLKYLTGISCESKNQSAYCRKCAYKLKFKCKNCRTGRIKRTRKM